MRTRGKLDHPEAGGALLIVLVTATLAVTLGTMLIISVTSASIAERREEWAAKARWNAESGVVLAEPHIKADLDRLFETVARELASRPDVLASGVPALTTLQISPLAYDYDLSNGAYGAGERAEVTAEVTLAGPPIQRSLSGVGGERRGVIVDDYEWRVTIRSTGYSGERDGRVARATAVAVSPATLKVALLSGPGTSPLIQKIAIAAGGGGGRRMAEGEAPGEPVPAAAASRGEFSANRAATWSLSPVSNVSANYPGMPSPPASAWSGPPEIVEGPTLVGYPSGDSVYLYKLRGLRTGARGKDTNTAVLCTDDWRWSPTFVRGSDDAEFVESLHRPVVRRKGSPFYAVVMVRAPAVNKAGVPPPDFGVLVLADGTLFTLPVPGAWQPPFARLIGPDGRPYQVTGQPPDAFAANAEVGLGVMAPSQTSPTGYPPDAAGPQEARMSQRVTIEGYAQDIRANPTMFPTVVRPPSGNGVVGIPLLEVLAVRNSMRMSWNGGTPSDPVLTSSHAAADPVTMEIPPPGGGCTDCFDDPTDPDPPEIAVAAVATMFVPGDISVVPSGWRER